jgi:hypothetical protein
MRPKPVNKKDPAETAIWDIRRTTQRHDGAIGRRGFYKG